MEIFNPTTAIASAGAGFIASLIVYMIKSFVDTQSALLNLAIKRTVAADDSADKAAKRDGVAGKFIRRGIYFACIFTICIAPFIFAWTNIPVVVEERSVWGGWLFGLIPEWNSTAFNEVRGFYIPDSIQRAFISYLIPFYLGRGVAR